MNRVLRLFTLFALIASFSGSSFAQDRSRQWGLGLDLGLNIPVAPDTLKNIADPDLAMGAHVRYHLNSFWGLALSYDRLEFHDTNLRTNTFNAGAFARLLKDRDFTPWIGLGVGMNRVSNYSLSTGDYWRPGFKAELGVEHDCAKSLSFGLKAVYYFVAKNGASMHVLTPTLSATWYFGGSRASASPAPSEAPRQDFVEQLTSKSGLKINVEFDSGKASLKEGSLSEIEKLADFMKDESKAHLMIAGHTDSTGNAEHNKKLSQDRANTVRLALINEFKIDASRIESVGMGSSEPVGSNKTADGRARNRRVVATATFK